jgi:hydrogenase large subunit
VKDKLQSFVAGGQLGIFTNGYWGHPAMKLSPEVNLLATAHYLQALDQQREVNKVVAMLGSKTPNIQNLAVGGVANAINLDSSSTLNMASLFKIKELLDGVVQFIQQVYLPDVCAVGAMYADWLPYGAGVTNYMASPDLPLDNTYTSFDLPGGTIFGGDLSTVKAFKTFDDPYFTEGVTENTSRAWYEGDGSLHPWKGETVPNYTDFDKDGKYSWVKAPRFQGKPMQVGPLAQVLVGYAHGARAHPQVGGRGPRHHLHPGRAPSSRRRCCTPRWAAPGPRHPHRDDRRRGAEALAAPGGEHRQGRHRHLQPPRTSPRARSRAWACTRHPAACSPTGR